MNKKLALKTPEKLKTPQGRRYLAISLTFLLGILITIAIKQNDQPELLTSAREGELVLILDDLTKQKDLLEDVLIKQNQVVPHVEASTQQSTPDLASQLSSLNDLFQSGVLSEEEFNAAKAKILGA